MPASSATFAIAAGNNELKGLSAFTLTLSKNCL
jgi:hypothetical protein